MLVFAVKALHNIALSMLEAETHNGSALALYEAWASSATSASRVGLLSLRNSQVSNVLGALDGW